MGTPLENDTTQVPDNSTAQEPQAVPGAEAARSPELEVATPDPSVTSEGWKQHVSADLRGSPLLSKFDDTPDGLNKALESHANLEQLLGHEKIPIPKDINDTEGWNRFSKAMGVPDAADGYGLADPKLPESMKGITIDKGKFAEVVHAFKLTPEQAKGLWSTYTDLNIESYNNAMKAHEETLTKTINTLKGEWGDTYDVNVELGQAVINKFTEDQDGNDFITAVLSSDPRGIKFLAKIGDQFAENKIPEFSMKRFSLAPEEAQNEIDKMTNDLEGPYMNVKSKFTEKEHQAAMDRVNYLRQTINKAKG